MEKIRLLKNSQGDFVSFQLSNSEWLYRASDVDALREAVKRMMEDVARIAYNYGFNQGMIEARPYSKGGIDFQTAWTRMQEGKQFKQAITAVEKVLNEND